MTDEHKLSSIKVVFTNGTTEVFNNVEDACLDEHTLRMTIADRTYYTRIFIDKVVYYEEVLDNNNDILNGENI